MGLFGHNGFLSKLSKGDKDAIATVAAPFTGGTSLLAHSGAKKVWQDITGQTSAKEANERNIALQKETNQQSIDLANTAHQREVEDLKKAGLNPILSAGGAGAVTPALGTAQVQNELPGGLLGVMSAAASIGGNLAQMGNLSSASKLNQAQAANITTDTQLKPLIAKADIASKYANAGNAKAQADYTNIMGQINQMTADADKTFKEKMSDYIDKKTPYGGKTMNTIGKGLDLANSAMNLAKGGMQMATPEPIEFMTF